MTRAQFESLVDDLITKSIEPCKSALKDAGVSDYSIWLDPETHHLFAILTRSDDHTLDALPDTEICKKWWAFMADIMETDEDNVPNQIPLKRVFLLP